MLFGRHYFFEVIFDFGVLRIVADGYRRVEGLGELERGAPLFGAGENRNQTKGRS